MRRKPSTVISFLQNYPISNNYKYYDLHISTVREVGVVNVSFMKLAVLVCVVAMMSLAFYPETLAEPVLPDTPRADDSSAIKLHFKGQGFTTAPPRAGNSTEEKASASGKNIGGRKMGTMIGEWIFTARGDFQTQGAFTAALWASSDKGAKGGSFRLNVNLNGNNRLSFYSEKKEVSTPVKFSISETATLAVTAGTAVGIGLVWISDPNHFVGPSSGGDFLYGSSEHDSYITITLAGAPIVVNISKPEMEKDSIKLVANVTEALGMDPTTFFYKLIIVGPATVLPEHMGVPSISSSDNGTSVTWLWAARKSKAISGEYAITVSVSYDGNISFQNSSKVTITFQQAQTTDAFKNLASAGGGLLLPIIIIGIAAGVGGGGYVLFRAKKKKARLASELAEMA